MEFCKDLYSAPYSLWFKLNDLPACLEAVPRFFAEDTALLIHSNNTAEFQTLTNSELASTSQWILCLIWRNCMLFVLDRFLLLQVSLLSIQTKNISPRGFQPLRIQTENLS